MCPKGSNSGLTCIVSRKLNALQVQLKDAKQTYLQIFQTPGAQQLMEHDDDDDDDDGGLHESSSESSSDDESVIA